MTTNAEILTILDEKLVPQRSVLRDYLCLVKTGDCNNIGVHDFTTLKQSVKVVDTLKLWPALKFTDFKNLCTQIPTNSDMNIRGHLMGKYRQLLINACRLHDETNVGIAYLFGRGDLMVLPKNDDGEIKIDNEVVFEFNPHINEMLSGKEVFCKSDAFQYAYKKAIGRLNVNNVGGAPTEGTPSYMSMLVNFVRPSTWANIRTSPDSPVAHFPVEGAAIMPPTIGNDDDVKILPSNDTSKSTDTEESELSSYPDSSGAMVAPPKVKDVLTGGKRKEGSKPTRRKKKRQKSKSKNENCLGGARVVDTPLGNGEVRRECLKHAVFNLFAPEEMKRVRDLSLSFICYLHAH